MIYSKKNLLLHALTEKANAYPNHLSTVHVTEKFMEVTDGHYLVRVSRQKNGNGAVDIPKNRKHLPFKKKRLDVCISSSSIRAVLDALPKTRYPMGFTSLAWVGRKTDKETTEFITSDGQQFATVSAKNEETKFPDTDKMVKSYGLKRKPKIVLAFNPLLMAKLCSYLIKSEITSVDLAIYNDVKPMRITAEKDDQEFYALLMPVKRFEKRKAEPAKEPPKSDGESEGGASQKEEGEPEVST